MGQALAQLPHQYIRVLTKPSAATFTQEIGKASWGIFWIQLLGFAFFSGLIFALLGLLDLAVRGTTLSALGLSFGVVAVALIAFLLVVAFFFIHTGIFYLFAKMAGGQGTFLAQSYSTLLFLVPGGMIVEVLTLLVGFVAALGWLFLLVWPTYSTILEILVIKAVHRLSGEKSTAVVLTPPVVVFVVAGISTSSLPREAHADPAELLGYFTAVLGVAFLVIMLILSWLRRATGSKKVGRRIVATVARVDWQAPMGLPGNSQAKGEYVVMAVWTDPQTQRAYTFWQRFDRPPRCMQGGPVSIMLDSSNPGRYYMELYEQ
jgi:preprotein translocase subunit SecG